MASWSLRVLALALGLLMVGIALVAISGRGGNSTGGSEVVWRIGGPMAYASAPAFLFAAVVAAVTGMRRLTSSRH
jgi:hypothetical protein